MKIKKERNSKRYVYEISKLNSHNSQRSSLILCTILTKKSIVL